MVHLRSLDECRFHTGRATLGPEAELVFAFLLYFAMERGKRLARAAVAELFWPGAREESARHCLRQTVYKLRQLGVPLESTPTHLHLPASAVERDFDGLFAPSAFEVDGSGTATVVGDFLPGYAPRISPAYADWLEQQRTYVHAGVRRALLAALLDRSTRGEWLEVEALARRCLQIDPLNEEATLRLAEAAAMSGAKAQALGILDEFLTELGPDARDIRLPASILRRRIAERLPFPRYSAAEACFVGRADSMAFLAERLKRARAGEGGGCLVWGDAGLGKTRLTQEFARVATLQGAQIQRHKCQASDPGRPLSLFVDVVPELLALPGALGCAPRSLSYLKRLTEHDMTVLEPSEETKEADFLYASVRQALFDLVDAVAGEAPLMVIVEDVHWLDRWSWQVLREMIEWGTARHLLFVLTSRTAGVTPETRTEPLRGLDRHRLPPLDPLAGSELLDSLLREHRRRIDDRSRAWCLTTGDGNPLYLRELLAYWLESGDTSRIPPTLGALIDERVARLEPEVLRVYQACALLGNNAGLERLEALLERKAHELIGDLEELEAYGLLAPEASRALCRHDLLAGAALRRLSDAATRLMHRRAGALLEREIGQTQNASLLWDCARHWERAGEEGRSLALARSCGVHLLEVGLPNDSAETFERALEYCRTVEERLDLLSCLIYALKHGGRWARVREVCDVVTALRREVGAPEHVHDDIELDRLEAGWRLDEDLVELLAAARRCVECPTAGVLHRVRAAARALIFADNLGCAESAHAIYNVATDFIGSAHIAESESLHVALIYHASFGDVAHAAMLAPRIVELQRQKANPAKLATALSHAAYVLRRAGREDLVTRYLYECFEIAESCGNVPAALSAAEQFGLFYLDRGDYRSAQAWYDRACNLLDDQDPGVMGSNLRTLGARLLLLTGSPDAADKLLEFEAAEARHDSVLRRRSERSAVWLLIQLGRGVDGANLTEVIDDLQTLFTRLRGRGGVDVAACALAAALRHLDRATEASHMLNEYISGYRRERGELPLYIKKALAEASA